MTVKHTPGPLHVEDGAGRWDDDGDWDSVVVVPVDGDEVIAELFYKAGDADAEANTRADAALFAAAPTLANAVEATLLFHSAQVWDPARRQRWFALAGTFEATTKTLCDLQRAALDAAGRLP